MIFVLVFTGVPLALWLLAAQSRRGRLVGTAVFVALGLAQWVTGHGWLGDGRRYDAPVALGAMIVLAGIAAPILERRLLPDLPELSGFARMRVFVGLTLSFVYTGLLALASALLLFVNGVLTTHAPARDAIGTLPHDLVVVGSADEGCSSGDSTDACTRSFVIGGPGSPTEIRDRTAQHLRSAFGCVPIAETTPGLVSDDWFSDRCHTRKFETASIYVRDGEVTVYLRNLTDFL